MKKEVLVIKRDLGREPFSPLMIEASVKGAMRDLDLDTESKENEMMSDLRTKYGNFSLQDVFDTLYNS